MSEVKKYTEWDLWRIRQGRRNVREHEGIAIKTIQNETWRKSVFKNGKKFNTSLNHLPSS